MALFSRKAKAAELAEVVAEAVKGALAGTPYAASGAQPATMNVLPTLPNSQQPTLVQSLARDPETFGGQLGPGFPLVPMVIDPLGPNGRPDPRKSQYDISINLNVNKELARWNTLKAAATQIDIIARAIAIRTSDLVKMEWAFTVSPDAINRIMDRDNCSHAIAARKAREENLEQIADLTAFWENPYPQSDRGWREWLSEALWQVLVFDGLAIHPAMNLGRKTIGFNIIDASTIKILLDNKGDFPRPPEAAYQQILWGFPRGEFTASPDSDVQNFMGGEYNIMERDQLSYFVMNRRTDTPYGFSPTEMSLELANLYMERQRWLMAEYRHGTSAQVYMKTTGSDLTLQNLVSFERIYNDYMEGQTQTRHRTKLVPEGWEPIFAPTLDERYKEGYDEHIIKRIAGFFGVSAQQFGVVPRAGLGGGKGAAEGEAENAETVSQRPMTAYIEEIVNSLSRRYLGATKDITFVLKEATSAGVGLEKANADAKLVASGVKTVNMIQAENGEPLFDFPEADEPFVLTGSGPIYLRGSLSQEDSDVPTPQGAQGQEGQSAQGAEGGEAHSPSGETDSEIEANSRSEKAAFAKFVKARIKKGTWRDFTFVAVSAHDAEMLNAEGRAKVTQAQAEERWKAL